MLKLILRHGLFPLIGMILSAMAKAVFVTFPAWMWRSLCRRDTECQVASWFISAGGAGLLVVVLLMGFLYDMTFWGPNWPIPAAMSVVGLYLSLMAIVRILVFLMWTAVPGGIREPEK